MVVHRYFVSAKQIRWLMNDAALFAYESALAEALDGSRASG
jgi:hypothetical protein